MKRIILHILLFSASSLFGQNSGVIEYKIEQKFEIETDNLPDGMDISSLLPTSNTSYKTLYFDEGVSLFKTTRKAEQEDTELESDDGSFKMVIKTAENESAVFQDQKKKEFIEQQTFMGRTFLINHEWQRPTWKITNEKIKYLDYECQKAVTESEPDEDGNTKEIIAWFTTQIPVSIGPESYQGLPGAILMLSIDGEKTQYKATAVSLEKPLKENLTPPKKGKKVSSEEFMRLVEERTKELTENLDGASFIIRN